MMHMIKLFRKHWVTFQTILEFFILEHKKLSKNKQCLTLIFKDDFHFLDENYLKNKQIVYIL